MLESDESALRELARSCKDAKEKVRLLALHAISLGYSAEKAAEIFCVGVSSVYHWIEHWQEERSLQEKERSGRPPAFSEKEKDELRKLVEESNPREEGLNASAWDCSELQRYFALQGKNVSVDTIRRCLKEMGARYVKAILQYEEADLQAQIEFAKKFLAGLRGEKAALIFFQDEMSAELSPRKGYGWTFEKRLVVEAPQSNWEKLNAFGAVNPFSGEIVEMTSSESKTPAFLRFLRKLLAKHPRRRLEVYLDGLSVHKSRKVKRFLRKHPRLRLVRLPAYSPELNPKEYWHAHLRRKLLNNKTFASARALALAINKFAKNASREVVRSVCTLQPLYKLALQKV